MQITTNTQAMTLDKRAMSAATSPKVKLLMLESDFKNSYSPKNLLTSNNTPTQKRRKI